MSDGVGGTEFRNDEIRLQLGNDIVSLDSPENLRSFRRKSYVTKSCTEQEIDLYRPEKQYETFWMLWAAKEAAYKSAVKLGFNLPFSAQKFSVKALSLQKSEISAIVAHENSHFQIAGKCTEQFVHVVSYHDELFQATFTMKEAFCSTHQNKMSRAVRELFIRSVESDTKLTVDLIAKDERGLFPFLRGFDLSFSHDYGNLGLVYRKC